LEANAWRAPSPPTSTIFEFDVAMWDEEDTESAESAVLTRGREGWRIEDQSSRQEVPGAGVSSKENLLKEHTAQSGDLNQSGDDWLREMENWKPPVS